LPTDLNCADRRHVDPGVFQADEAAEREAVLTVRLWSDGNLPEGLRARIRSTLDLASGEEKVTMAADVGTVLDTVRAWLEAYLAG